MSSPEKEGIDLKAGHAPATKVGGMRVVQHKKEEKPEAPTPLTAEEKEEFGVEDVKEKPHLVVSGAVTKGDKDFTPQAVKSYHEKPVPIHDSRPRQAQTTPHINQPR